MQKKKKAKINHDVTADVLYIIIGDARPSYAETIDDGIYARYDMETDELTGITILDFSKRPKNDVLDIIISEKVIARDDQSVIDILQ